VYNKDTKNEREEKAMKMFRNEKTGIVSLENVKTIKSVTATQIKVDYMNGECAFIHHSKGDAEDVFNKLEQILLDK
jgi:hypothetical protein